MAAKRSPKTESWTKLVADYHRWAHKAGGHLLFTGKPATDDELAQLEARLKVKLPVEFKDLYRTYNGIGTMTGADAPTGTSEEQAAQFEATFGFPMPEAMQTFRQECGEKNKAPHAEAVQWLFVPLSEIPELTSTARGWFQETHAEDAGRFVPFIDWGCGDYTGYLPPHASGALVELHTFEHESYLFDEAQEVDEFLTPSYSSIREFFLLR